MAYSVKYLFKFESSNGTTREIRVLQDGYSGGVIQRPLGRAPVLKKQQNGPVHGTSLEFYAECNVDREFIEFYTSDPKAYRVDLYAGATLLWQGYITPELYSEPDIAPPYDVQVVATDGVGELKLYDYAAQGATTLRALLQGLLAHTGLGTDIFLISSLKPGSRGAGALLDMVINLDYMAGKTCYETLTYVLDTLHATITWWKGAWILTRETNVTLTSGKVRYFNTAGNSALLADSVQALGRMYVNPAWPVGQLSTVIDPAKNKVAVQAPWHPVTCLQNPDMSSDASWAKSNDASYGPDGYLFPNNDRGTSTYATAYISQALAMEGLRVPMSFELRATGVSAQVGVRVGAVIGILLTYTVGNVVYHLRKGSEGAPEWTPGPAIGTSIDGSLVDYQRPLASFDMDRIQAETLQIAEIPAFVQGTSYPSGTLTVYILGTCARAYAATLDVVLPRGYQDILHIDNGARGEGGEVEIAIGRETSENAYYAAFLQGLLLDSGNLITAFSDANFPGGMDFLSFIARDYALSVALPRARVTGTVSLENSVALPPLVFSKGALNYWAETWSWNLYDDELEISALTLPAAALTVASETILESTTTASSSTGRSSSDTTPISAGVSMATVQEWVGEQNFASQQWVLDRNYLTGIDDDMIATALGYTPLGPTDLNGYATQTWVNNQHYLTAITATDIETALDYIPLGPDALNGYATQTWVGNQGYATQTWVQGRGYLTAIDDDMVITALGYTPVDPSDLTAYATKTWVQQQNYLQSITAADIETALDYVPLGPSSLDGYATQTWVNNQSFATQTWVQNRGYLTGIDDDMVIAALGYTPLSATDLSGYATQQWVNNQHYLTAITETDIETALDYVPLGPDDLNGYATQQWVNNQSYATQTWVNNKGYITGITSAMVTTALGYTPLRSSDLTGYATETWVNNKGYITGITSSMVTTALGYTPLRASDLNGYYNTGNANRTDTDWSCRILTCATDLQIGTSSDARLKEEVRTIPADHAAKVVAALRPVDFQWNDDAIRMDSRKAMRQHDVGFIAQEVRELIPDAVTDDYMDHLLRLDKTKIIPYLVAALQQLQGEVRKLKEDRK